MSTFDNCFPFLLANEGTTLYEDKTTGERSRFGVTAKLLTQVNWYPSDPNQLDENSAKNVYYIFFWQKYGLDKITSDIFARKILDMIVNMGPKQAGLLLQRALGFPPDRLDGVIGYWTITDLNQWTEATIMPKIVDECVDFYTKLAASKPELAKDLAGWLIRARKS